MLRIVAAFAAALGLLMIAASLAAAGRQFASVTPRAALAHAAQAGGQAGAITTTAKVEAKDMQEHAINLKPQEKIALMFMEAISNMEDDCGRHLSRPCPLDELVKGPKAPDWNIGRLKYDPAQDANYKYSVEISSGKWKARAVPQHPGIGGFFYDGSSMIAKSYYNPNGPATADSTRLGEIDVAGETFNVH
jgi:hypothetical protein